MGDDCSNMHYVLRPNHISSMYFGDSKIKDVHGFGQTPKKIFEEKLVYYENKFDSDLLLIDYNFFKPLNHPDRVETIEDIKDNITILKYPEDRIIRNCDSPIIPKELLWLVF